MVRLTRAKDLNEYYTIDENQIFCMARGNGGENYNYQDITVINFIHTSSTITVLESPEEIIAMCNPKNEKEDALQLIMNLYDCVPSGAGNTDYIQGFDDGIETCKNILKEFLKFNKGG